MILNTIRIVDGVEMHSILYITNESPVPMVGLEFGNAEQHRFPY